MATNTTATSQTHNGNGSLNSFPISFSFLANAEVDVTVGGEPKTLGTHYNISGSTVTFTSGNTPPSGTNNVKFQRNTNISAKKVDFQDGSVLTETDLDTTSNQILFAQQEITDKLDGIESGATADQTNAEIRAAVEAASDSNVFTDADHTKLNAIEDSATADQTSGEIKTLLQSDKLTVNEIADDAITYAKIQNVSATDRVLGRDSSGAGEIEEITPANLRTMINVEDGATGDQTAAEIRTLVESASDSNVFTDADHTKLNGISAGADVTSTNSINALTDVNTSGVADGKILKYQASSNSFIIADDGGGGGSGASAFTGLSDTPSNFGSAANKVLIVNSSSNAIEFVDGGSVSGILPLTGGTLTGDVTFGDMDKVIFGDGGDFDIYHSGNGSFIRDVGFGPLQILTNKLHIKNAANTENMIECSENSEVKLFYDNAEKLYTTSYGVEIRGDGNTGDGTLQLNCSQNTHGIKLKSPPHSAAQSYTLTFPSSILNNGFLKTDANGNLSFAAVDTDLVNDSSPQLGGNLDMQSNNITGTGTITANSVASNANGMRKITTSTSDPTSSDGADGDVWFTYAA